MNKLRAKSIFRSLPAVRKSISKKESKVDFFGHPPSMLHEIKFIFNITPPIIYFHRARCTNELKMSVRRTHNWVSIFVPFFFFSRQDLLDIFDFYQSPRVNLSLFRVSRNLKIFISTAFFCAIFKHNFFVLR